MPVETTSLWILFEEPSATEAGRILVPKVLGPNHPPVYYIQHQCKADLLNRLPGLLRGYSRTLNPGDKVVVLIDKDREDCKELKERLEEFVRKAGFLSTAGRTGTRRVFVRIAVEELEAWYFGDWAAVCQAFPNVPETIPSKSRFRDPDDIRGGTKEAFERILQRAGYYRTGVPRIEVARRIAQFMDPAQNTSRSFQLFRDTLQKLVS